MDNPNGVNWHPVIRGLVNSGYVVSVIQGNTALETNVLRDERYICLTLPGNPCRVLFGFSPNGARLLIDTLTTALAELDSPAQQ